jgi:hypothetical protein
VRALAWAGWIAATALLATGAQAAERDWRNVTRGGPLRPGIYGRIVFKSEPPPIIYREPVIATQAMASANAQPLYLYVPPGQVRRWPQHCARWSACNQPVLFVRVEDSPSRWGRWRQLREPQWALRARD